MKIIVPVVLQFIEYQPTNTNKGGKKSSKLSNGRNASKRLGTTELDFHRKYMGCFCDVVIEIFTTNKS